MQDQPLDELATGGYRFNLTDSDDPAIHDAVLGQLQKFNRHQAGDSARRPLSIVTRDGEGRMVGGLHGVTSWGWLFTHLLLLPEELRGRGLGRQLMLRAEAEAVARGCHGAWLDTFEFQGRRGFYESLGYQCVATLPDYPRGYARYIMQKPLAASS